MSAGIRIAARPNADEHRDEDHDDSVPPANPDAFNVAPNQDLRVPVYALVVPEEYHGSLAAAVDHGPGLQALAYTVATQHYTHHPHNGTNGSADDDDDGGSDSDGSLESLASEDFPTYFEEHRGRLFHSHGNLNNAGLDPGYILPVDGPELQRYNATHTLLRRVLGSNFFAPLAQSLVDGATVLDLCTGTGLWTMEMARAYPQVEFHGLDMVPITSRYPENNVTFELTDVRLRLRFGHASIDIVHARNTNMSVQGYARMLAEAARVLRPGGIFVAGEWVTYAPADTQPHLAQFWQEANEAVSGQVITPLALAIPHLIDASGAFSPPVSHMFAFPLGELDPNAAHTFGPDVAQALDAVGQTMRLLTVAHIEALHAGVPTLAGSAAAAIEEVEGGGVGRVAIWHGVWASRL